MSDLGREFRSWRVRAIPNSKRRGCSQCSFWTGPHRRWFMASRELRRHTQQKHGRHPRGMQPAKVQVKPPARKADTP